jgi:hypothetical protein
MIKIKCGKTLSGVIIGITATLLIKGTYEYGRYSAQRDWADFKIIKIVEEDQEEGKTTGK